MSVDSDAPACVVLVGSQRHCPRFHFGRRRHLPPLHRPPCCLQECQSRHIYHGWVFGGCCCCQAEEGVVAVGTVVVVVVVHRFDLVHCCCRSDMAVQVVVVAAAAEIGHTLHIVDKNLEVEEEVAVAVAVAVWVVVAVAVWVVVDVLVVVAAVLDSKTCRDDDRPLT